MSIDAEKSYDQQYQRDMSLQEQSGIQTTEEYVEWANTLDSAGTDSTEARDRAVSVPMVKLLSNLFYEIDNVCQKADDVKKYIYYGKDHKCQVYPDDITVGQVSNALTRLNDHETIRLLHALLGIVSEAQEMFELLGKYIFEGQEIDKTHLREEIGDCQWYAALVAKYVGDDGFGPMLLANYNKLTTRYPDKVWTQDHALNRDLDKEMEALKLNEMS